MVFSEVDTNFTSSFYKINQPCKIIIILLSCMLTFSHSYLSVHHAVFLKYLNWYRSGLVLDYSLSVPYLDTKNEDIKVFILGIHFGNRFWLFGIQFWICYSFCFLECREWVPDFFTSNWRHERAADFEVSSLVYKK